MSQSFSAHTLFNLVLVTFIPFAVLTPGLYSEGVPETNLVLEAPTQTLKESQIEEPFPEANEEASEHAASMECADETDPALCPLEPSISRSSL